MSVKIIEENANSSKRLFLPPTVLAVKSLAKSKLLLIIGILGFIASLAVSACDLTAFAVLLPIGALLLIAHLVTFKKAKRDYGSYGLKPLSVCYTLSAVLCIAFGIAWNLAFTQEYMIKALDLFNKLLPAMPEQLETILTVRQTRGDLICLALALLFLSLGAVLASLKSAEAKNRPALSVSALSGLMSLSVAGFFGFNGVKIAYLLLANKLSPVMPSNFKLSMLIDASVITLFSVIAVLAGIYCFVTLFKMKKAKNVIQK